MQVNRLIPIIFALMSPLGMQAGEWYGQTYTETAAVQDITLNGTVVDSKGVPLIGAFVVEKGNESNGEITDLDGNFSMRISPGATVSVSYIGCKTVELKVNGTGHITVVLEADELLLEDAVVVGYGTQKKISVTGSVAAIGTSELVKSTQPNLSAALAGRLPGLTTMQTSGRPGADDVTMYLRGASTINGANPLILVDGVPRDGISSMDPTEIASVSILKDASATAVFGVRGANGVILITTRRGNTGKPLLNVSANYSLQQFISRIDRVHSSEFAKLRNQAFTNDGKGAIVPYSDYMIQMYQSGEDPVFYPDRDIMDEFFKKWAPQFRANMNMSGGKGKVDYFINVGYISQDGQFKTESKDKLGYDASYRMNRYTFRSNLDYRITDGLKLSLNIASYLQKSNSPFNAAYGSDIDGMVADMLVKVMTMPPLLPGPVTPEGYVTRTGEAVIPDQVVIADNALTNKYGDINRSGYMEQTNLNLNTQLALDWNLDFITKGLSTKFMAAFDTKSATSLYATRGYNTYTASVSKTKNRQSYFIPKNVSSETEISAPSKSSSSYYYLNLQYSLNYAREFGKHAVTGMALLQRDNWEYAAADLPYNMLGLSARFTYGYDDRYLAEVNLGYNGSEQFAKGNRFGFFPAVSAGWVISNEKFLKENKVLSHLKLRASYGKVGNDKLGSSRFLYLDNIVLGNYVPDSNWGKVDIPSLGRGQSVLQKMIGNPELTWEIAYKQNYGIDMQFFRQFSLSVDYFREDRNNVLIQRGTVPTLQGIPLSSYPKVNYGQIMNNGFEVDATWQTNFPFGLSMMIKGNFAYNKNKQVFMDEPKLSEDYYARYRKTGYSINQCFGYEIDYSSGCGNGFINTEEELERAKEMYKIGTPRLGDFLYKDLNGDGFIDEKDITAIGYSNIPQITYGFSGSLSWKNFDFSFQFAGIARASRAYISWLATEIGTDGFYTDYMLNAWTPQRYANGEKIEYPALSTVPGVSHIANSFFIMDRSFLRLKTVELGYTLPHRLLSRISMSELRVYISGNNLLTWKKIDNKAIDPEVSWEANYPLTKMINIGVNIGF